MRYTTKQRNDEHDQFMSNAYDQTFTQNIQLSDWFNTTTSNLHEKTREVRAGKQLFEEYKNQAVENSEDSFAVDAKKLLRSIAEALRLQQAEEVVPVVSQKTTLVCLDEKMDKKSSRKSSKLKKETEKKA